MHLTDLRGNPPLPPHYWPGVHTEENKALMNRAFDLVDATLNSWKEAHAVFDSRYAKHPLVGKELPKLHVDHFTMSRMTPLVIKALRQVEDDPQMVALCTNSYPSESLAFALIEAWARAEDA